MSKWLLSGLAALALMGCDDGSPFNGHWTSGGASGTGSSYRLGADGQCRYMNGAGIGRMCEWEKQSDKFAIITRKDGDIFIESEASMVGKELFVTTRAGEYSGIDIFQKAE